MKQKTFSIFIVLAILISMFSIETRATGAINEVKANEVSTCKICGEIHDETHEHSDEELCQHIHDEECGYTEGIEGHSCSHEHTEECYQLVTNCIHEHTDGCTSAGNVEDIEILNIKELNELELTQPDNEASDEELNKCPHHCTEENGCITKEFSCSHEHNVECGYIESLTGTPCQYECFPMTKLIEANEKSIEYTVGTDADFNNAISAISSSADTEATIVLAADIINVSSFEGIADKHITIKSSAGSSFVFNMGKDLVGDITLDNIKLSVVSPHDIFANGHLFETTSQFEFVGTNQPFLYGGGKNGQNVTGDTNLVLRGGEFSSVYGGGLDSDVDGNTNVLIDGSNVFIGNLYGGGNAKATASGTVQGSAHINFRQGKNGMLFGGGQNTYSKDNRDSAKVFGTANVTLGYKGAPAGTVNTGTAMYTHGGSWNSTVGNVVLQLLEGSTNYSSGGDRNYYGCGYRDTVLGTVRIIVDGSDLRSSGYIYGGGDYSINMDDTYGSIEILNQNNEELALEIKYSSPSNNIDGGVNAGSSDSITTEINGNVRIQIDEGNIAFSVLDNENEGNCIINGNSEILIKGGRIAQIEGNKTNPIKSTVIYDGCGSTTTPQESGYINRAGKTILKNKAMVEINSLNFSQFPRAQKPFYNVSGLEVQSGSKLTTVAGQAWVYGDIILNGTWEQKFVGGSDYNDLFTNASFTSNGGTLISHGTVYIKGDANMESGKLIFRSPALIQGNFTVDNSEIRLPVMAAGTNYPTVDIPLWIKGTVTGNAKVFTMDHTDWTKDLKPVLGENYIVALRQGSEKVFELANVDAKLDGLYFKKLADINTQTPENDMWQVAKGYTVIYDANGGTGTLVDDSSPYEKDDTVSILDNTFINGSKNFIGWKDANGNDYTVGSTFNMPANNVILYAQWETTGGGSGGGDAGVTTYYTLTYETNGGSTIASKRVKESTIVELTQVPVREGYTFEGWYKDEELTERITSVYMNKDKTVYAKWKENKASIPLIPLEPAQPVEPSESGSSTKPDKLPDTNVSSLISNWLSMSIISGLALIIIFSKKRCN